MERNWIEDIKKFVNKAISNRESIYYSNYCHHYEFEINEIMITCSISDNKASGIQIFHQNKKEEMFCKCDGYTFIPYEFSDRDKLELESLIITIKEYQEKIAINEFTRYITENSSNKELTINDLDDEND